MKTLTEMLTEREAIAQLCETILDEGTEIVFVFLTFKVPNIGV